MSRRRGLEGLEQLPARFDELCNSWGRRVGAPFHAEASTMADRANEVGFEVVVKRLLDGGMAEIRGWTRAEYLAKCRRLWDECEVDEEFPFKVLIDTRMSMSDFRGTGEKQYWDSRFSSFERSDLAEPRELYCEAIGLMRPDGSMETGQPEEALPEATEPQVGSYLVGFFDVLGFEFLLGKLGLRSMQGVYSTLMESLVQSNEVESQSLVRVGPNEYCAASYRLPVRSAYFSDSILVWVPLVQHHINPFLSRCADLICEGLRLGIPLRGAVSIGECVLHPRSGTYLGEPLVEAARLEAAQEWVGAALGLSALAPNFRREMDPSLVIPYEVPVKSGREDLPSNLVLDWPRRARERRELDPTELVVGVRFGDQEAKRENSLKFVDSSAALANAGGTESLGLSSLGELSQQALDARGQTELPRDLLDQLALADRLGGEYAVAAGFLRAVAEGQADLVVPQEVPQPSREFLERVRQASLAELRLVDLLPLGQRVLESRWTDGCLSQELEDELMKFEEAGDGLEVLAVFLRSLGRPETDPEVPPVLPDSLEQAVEVLVKAAKGETPPADVGRIGEAVVVSRVSNLPLPEVEKVGLRLLSLAGKEYAKVGDYLSAVAGHQPLPGALEEISPDYRGLVRRVVASTRDEFVPSVGFPGFLLLGDSISVDVASLSGEAIGLRQRRHAPGAEFESQIEALRAHGTPHDAVANMLNDVARGREIVLPENLPMLVSWHLMLVKAICLHEPIPMALEFLGIAAVHSRVSKKGMATYAGFGFHLLCNGLPESRLAASFLSEVAGGGALPEVPDGLPDDWRRELKQVRALAEFGPAFRAPVMRTRSSSS